MMQWHQFEIDSLHSRPKHPIFLQRRPVRSIELILGACSLHDRHTAEKAKQIGRGEHGLIGQDPRGDGSVGVCQVDPILEELEPRRGCRAENS